MDILGLTALELGEKIQKREISAREAAEAALAQAQLAEPVINSYVTLVPSEVIGSTDYDSYYDRYR